MNDNLLILASMWEIEGRTKERAAIVSWLRSDPYHYMRVAGFIERGEHLTVRDDKPSITPTNPAPSAEPSCEPCALTADYLVRTNKRAERLEAAFATAEADRSIWWQRADAAEARAQRNFEYGQRESAIAVRLEAALREIARSLDQGVDLTAKECTYLASIAWRATDNSTRMPEGKCPDCGRNTLGRECVCKERLSLPTMDSTRMVDSDEERQK